MKTTDLTLSSRPLPGAWPTVALLWFGTVFNFLARAIIPTMHGSLVAAIPMTEAQFGLLTSVFLWVYGFLGPWAGFLADRFSRSRVIVVSLLTWSAVTWLTAYARTFAELLAMRALMAMSETGYIPAALALVSEYHRGPTRSFATGLLMTGVLVGNALAGLGGWLAELRTWHYAFSLVGVTGVVFGAFLVVALRDAPGQNENTVLVAGSAPKVGFGHALVELFRHRAFVTLVGSIFLLFICSCVILGWMPTYLKERFHIGQGAAGFAATGYQNMAGLIGLLVGGAWADRWSRTRVRGRIFVTVIGIFTAAPGILLTATTATFAWAIAGLALFGFGIGFSDSTMMPILCQITDSRYRATGYGVLNFVSTITAGLAVYATGALRDLKFDTGNILVVATGSLVIAGGLLLLVKPWQPESP